MATTSYGERDTSNEAQAMLDARFAAMTIAERATTAAQLCDATTTLAISGIHQAHPGLSDDDLRYHLALRRYGRPLADEVYGPRPGP